MTPEEANLQVLGSVIDYVSNEHPGAEDVFNDDDVDADAAEEAAAALVDASHRLATRLTVDYNTLAMALGQPTI